MTQSIVALWLFSSLIYNGQQIPPPNPMLKIYFQFESNGENTLHYFREGERGYCRRKAHYEFFNKQLKQKINWVDPQNASWCAQDPDMQMGRETTTSAWIEGSSLYLKFPMGEQDLIYVWEKATCVLGSKNIFPNLKKSRAFFCAVNSKGTVD